MKFLYTFWSTLFLALLTLASGRLPRGRETPPVGPARDNDRDHSRDGHRNRDQQPGRNQLPGYVLREFSAEYQVTLSETPATSNVFSGWSGACTEMQPAASR